LVQPTVLTRQLTEKSRVAHQNSQDYQRLEAFIKEKVPDSRYGDSPSAATPSVPTVSKLQLLVRGLSCLKDLQVDKQPSGEYYQANREQINKLSNKLAHIVLRPRTFKVVLAEKVQLPREQDVAEQVQVCIQKWSAAGVSEMQICKTVVAYLLPCISGSFIDTKQFYGNLELINTHSDNSSDDGESMEIASSPESPTLSYTHEA
jgi:hypothetical protein